MDLRKNTNLVYHSGRIECYSTADSARLGGPRAPPEHDAGEGRRCVFRLA